MRRPRLPLKCREPLAENIDAGVLLLKRIDLSLLRRMLLRLRFVDLRHFRVQLAILPRLISQLVE